MTTTALLGLGRRHAGVLLILCVAVGLLLGAATADAQSPLAARVADADVALAEAGISGANTLRFESYDVRGDTDASPYPATGGQWYDELSLRWDHRAGPYNRWRGEVQAVINESTYRSTDNGIIPERLRLFHERGDVALPYRLELGDVYGYFSYRTLQKSLKGLRLELHPEIGGEDEKHSLVLVSGLSPDPPSWRHLQARDSFTHGVSWLTETPALGKLSLNYAFNYRQGAADDSVLARRQHVYSLAGERVFHVADQDITLEGEIGRFQGDHDGTTDAESGQRRDANALFLQAAGKSESPLTYRLRYEAYERDYRPEGASVGADRESLEGHVGWRFAGGTRLRGRVQHFRDAWETDNPVDTNTYGLTLSGRLFPALIDNLSGNLDAHIQDVEDRYKRGTNQLLKTVSLDLSKPIAERLTARLGFYHQDVDDRLNQPRNSGTTEIRGGLDHPLQIRGLRGNIAPGVVVRKIDHPDSKALDLYPTLAVNLQGGAHSFGYAMSFSHQDRRAEGTDVGVFSQNLTYTYALAQDVFGVELTDEHREPEEARNTHSYRVAVYWTHRFGGSARRPRPGADRPAPAPRPEHAPYVPPAPDAPLDVREFRPGTDMADVRARLAAADVGGVLQLPGVDVYETRLLSEFDQRQRLALEHGGGKLTKAALIVDFSDVGRPETVEQTIQRLRQALLDRCGAPSRSWDKGDVSAELIDDVRTGAFVRITEWDVNGGTIRLGVPRRLDDQVRVEIQFAEDFPHVNMTLWSLELVR